jgi:hypothetical protein
MHDPRPVTLLPSRGPQLEQPVDERAVTVAGRGMHDDAGRLVHHEQVLVLVGDPQLDVLWNELGRLRLGKLDLDRLSALQPPAFDGRLAAEPNGSRGDQALGGTARPDLGQFGEETVEPRPGGGFRDFGAKRRSPAAVAAAGAEARAAPRAGRGRRGR